MKVIVTPEPGARKWVAQLLLTLADSPYEVNSVTWPRTGFMVSEELYAKFEIAAASRGDVQTQAVVASVTPLPGGGVAAVETHAVATVKRKPGRPRKNGNGNEGGEE